MSMTGLGPHGERPISPDDVLLTAKQVERAAGTGFRVAVVFHTTSSDWGKQSLAGIMSTLGDCGVAVTEIIDCGFDATLQIDALNIIAQRTDIDAVISIPVANSDVAEAHRGIARSGKKLILHDNVPTGLLPGRDYTSLVSSDNFNIGTIAATLLSPHLPEASTVGMLTFGTDFYATNEREISFGRWMRGNRHDLSIVTGRFHDVGDVKSATRELLRRNSGLSGLFVVWDVPAHDAVRVLDEKDDTFPIVTVDLGHDTAIALAQGHHFVGVAAQHPHSQGVLVARATIISLLGDPVPSWIAMKGLAVTKDNVAEAYQAIWSSPAPLSVRSSQTC